MERDNGNLRFDRKRGNSRVESAPAGPREPRRKPLQKRSVAMVDAILEASTRVFERLGFARANTNEIAEIAGVSIGSLYQYFPDKVALLTALHERHVATLTDRLIPIVSGVSAANEPLDSTLERVARCVVGLHFDHPALQKVLHQQYPQLAYPDEQCAAKRRLVASVTQWVKARRKSLGDAEAATVSKFLLSIGEGMVHAAILSPSAGTHGSRVETHLVCALRGYLREQGVS